ncbi:MAG: hypothetical protein ABJA71_02665 [Ginsengibacter sp.]
MKIITASFDDYPSEIYTGDGVFAMHRAPMAFYLLANLVKINFHFSHFENFKS